MPILSDPRYLSNLTTLTATKSNGLSVFLEFGNQGVTVLHHVRVLLVLVIGSVGFNNSIDAVNRAGNAVAGDELGQVAAIEKTKSVKWVGSSQGNIRSKRE
jgi:hypothetical protein